MTQNFIDATEIAGYPGDICTLPKTALGMILEDQLPPPRAIVTSNSPCDGGHPTTIGAGLVIDQVSVTDADSLRSEDFEDGTLDIGTFQNIHDSEPFGEWARLYPHITDNDFCTENTTCAWLWTDDTTPTPANDPSMAFGPGGFVVAWPSADTGALPVEGGVAVAFRREIESAADPEARRRELEEGLAARRSPFPRAEAFGVHDLSPQSPTGSQSDVANGAPRLQTGD